MELNATKDTPGSITVESKLDYLDSLKFTYNEKRNLRKRKSNPVEIKYEEGTEPSVFSQDTKLQKNNRKNFPYIYEKIKEMRKDLNAAVDQFGCSENHDLTASKDDQDFQILCSLLISVQNRDESTAAAMERLKAVGMTIDNIYNMTEQKVLEVLGGVNFNKTKAKNLKRAAQIVVEKYDGKMPKTWEQLLEFPGVGNKIAVIYMNTAHKANVGIGVDTHVHRVCNRIGLAHSQIADETRVQLEEIVPKQEWSFVNVWIVGFGQQICLPISPKCQICLLNDICPEGKKKMRSLIKIEEDGVKVEENEVKYTKKTKKNKDKINVKAEEIVDVPVKEEDTEKNKSKLEFEVKEEEEADDKPKTEIQVKDEDLSNNNDNNGAKVQQALAEKSAQDTIEQDTEPRVGVRKSVRVQKRRTYEF